jgi:hypothetical protein
LTAAHVAWYPDGTPNRMRFHPGYFDEESPFGSARVTAIRYYEPKIVRDENVSDGWNDFALLILDWPIGNVCGWMGNKAFSRNWSGLNVWSTIGYPGMFKRTSHVPTFERGFSVTLPAGYDENRAIVRHFAVPRPVTPGDRFLHIGTLTAYLCLMSLPSTPRALRHRFVSDEPERS